MHRVESGFSRSVLVQQAPHLNAAQVLMTLAEWFVLAAAAALGSVAQGATGFGCALVAIPVMLWGGVALPAAIAANTSFVLLQGVLACWKHRVTVPWKDTWTLLLLRVGFLPLGVFALSAMARWGASHVKQAVGAALLALLLLLRFMSSAPSPQPRLLWTGLAGSSSGFLTGAVGMGGPPVVAWTLLQDWTPSRARSFLWATSLQMTPVSLALLCWTFGFSILVPFFAAFAVMPIVILGGRWGAQLSNTWSRQTMRNVTVALLALTAALSIAAPWLERTRVS